MSPVPANTVGSDLVEQHAPYLTADLQDYLQAIGSMFAQVDAFADLDGEENGWSALLDPARCPLIGLPYLSQFVGERLPVGLAEERQREWITDAPNQARGTLYSIFRAAQRTLTGSRVVSIQERSGTGHPHPEDYITVRTYTAQTPDGDAVYADLRTVVPADIVFDYAVADGQTWDELVSDHATWNSALADYATWNEAYTDLAGYVNFDRPRPL